MNFNEVVPIPKSPADFLVPVSFSQQRLVDFPTTGRETEAILLVEN